MRRFVSSAAVLLSALLPSAALAQVGHPPGSSPYHDIPPGHTVYFTYGHLGGSGGKFGIGPHDGTLYGGRYDIRVSSLFGLGFAGAHGTMERQIVNPFIRVDDRVSGPVDQSLTLAEADLLFNLGGRKTWHRLAPLFSVGFGLAHASETPADTSGYNFGNKLYITPQLGLRAFVTNHLQLRGELRGVWWKLKYPVSFQQEPPLDPGTVDNPHAVIPNGKDTEWTGSLWLQVGIGYTFHW